MGRKTRIAGIAITIATIYGIVKYTRTTPKTSTGNELEDEPVTLD